MLILIHQRFSLQAFLLEIWNELLQEKAQYSFFFNFFEIFFAFKACKKRMELN
jgi:hypothetical protein